MDARTATDDESSLIYWLFCTQTGFLVLLILTGIFSELNTRLRGKQPRIFAKHEKKDDDATTAQLSPDDPSPRPTL